MEFEIIPATELSLAEQVQVVNAAFAGYIGGWTEMDPAALARFLHLQGADAYYSRFVATQAGLAGFGYINRTGNFLRLGAMALIESARGTGAAGYLLEHLLNEGETRGDAAMILEVIEQNPRAVAFYRRHGFRQISRLLGWRRPVAADHEPADGLREIPVLEALGHANVRAYPEIPWQLSGYGISRVERTRVFVRQDASVIVSDPEAEKIRIHGILFPAEDWTSARAAVAAIVGRFSNREFFVPPVWPEEFGREIFQPLGFQPEPLTQFFMRRDL